MTASSMSSLPSVAGSARVPSRVAHSWARLSGRWWVVLAVEAALLGIGVLDVLPWEGAQQSAAERVVSIIAVAGLLLRRWLPLVTWLACLPAIYYSVVLVIPLIAVYSVTRRAPRWWISAFVVTVTFGVGLAAADKEGIFSAGYTAISQTVVASAVLAVGPAACGLALAARQTLTAQLRRIVAMQDEERALLTGSAIASERTRLAREMHDVVSHQVSLIALQAGALRVTSQDEDVRSLAVTIRALATQTLDELRIMVGVLRSGPDTELAPQPRLADIAGLIRASGVQAVLHDNLPAGHRWSGQVERAAYRTVQEGLTNVRKHAPGATASVELSLEDGALTVTVRDDGGSGRPGKAQIAAAGHVPGGGHGLIGLRERAELLGGRLTITTPPGGGFELKASFHDPAALGHRLPTP